MPFLIKMDIKISEKEYIGALRSLYILQLIILIGTFVFFFVEKERIYQDFFESQEEKNIRIAREKRELDEAREQKKIDDAEREKNHQTAEKKHREYLAKLEEDEQKKNEPLEYSVVNNFLVLSGENYYLATAASAVCGCVREVTYLKNQGFCVRLVIQTSHGEHCTNFVGGNSKQALNKCFAFIQKIVRENMPQECKLE